MRCRVAALLIGLALAVGAAGAAWAGLGLGFGIDDVRNRAGSGHPATSFCLLIDNTVTNFLLIDNTANNCLLIQ